MYKILRKENCTTVRPDRTALITNYITKETSTDLSIVLSEINGDHGEYIYRGGMQIFLVVAGTIEFLFEDINITLCEGDCIQIYHEWHRKVGNRAKMVVVTYPAFDCSLEEIR